MKLLPASMLSAYYTQILRARLSDRPSFAKFTQVSTQQHFFFSLKELQIDNMVSDSQLPSSKNKL